MQPHNLGPELQIMVINAVIVLVAYLGIYPTTPRLTFDKLARLDLVFGALGLAVAGALFAGRGIGFSILVTDVHWAVFSILSFSVIELPFALRLMHRLGGWPGDDDDPPD